MCKVKACSKSADDRLYTFVISELVEEVSASVPTVTSGDGTSGTHWLRKLVDHRDNLGTGLIKFKIPTHVEN